MKKILFFLYVFFLCIGFTKNINAQAPTKPCIVTDSKFEPYTLHHLNKDNIWQEVNGEAPVVNLHISSKGCSENKKVIEARLFSIGYSTKERNLFEKVNLVKYTYKFTLDQDEKIIPLHIGNKSCSGYAIKNAIDTATLGLLSQKDNSTCKYFFGYLDDSPNSSRGTNLIKSYSSLFVPIVNLIKDNPENVTIGVTVPGGLKDGNFVGTFETFLKNHGLEFECTPTTCGKYDTKDLNEDGKAGITLNGDKAINSGYASDPCIKGKPGEECYSLVSKIPIPTTGGDLFNNEANPGIDYNNDGTADLFTFKTTTNTVGDNIPIEHTVIYGKTGFGWLFSNIFNLIIWLMIIAAVLRLIYIGYLQITTEGAKGKTDIRESFWNVFMGLAILFCTYIILNTINPDLLNVEPKLEVVRIEGEGDPNVRYGSTYTNTEGKSGTVGSFSLPPYAKDIGIFCPGTGGVAQLEKVARSFENKTTYRFGAKGMPPAQGKPYPDFKTCEGKICGTFCPSNSICTDCSGYVNHIYQCSGLPVFGGSGSTSAIFDSKSQKISTFSISGNDILINGQKLEIGDTIGMANKHVAMYIGNGYIIHSTAGRDGRGVNKNTQTDKLSDEFYRKNKNNGSSGWLDSVRKLNTVR